MNLARLTVTTVLVHGGTRHGEARLCLSSTTVRPDPQSRMNFAPLGAPRLHFHSAARSAKGRLLLNLYHERSGSTTLK